MLCKYAVEKTHPGGIAGLVEEKMHDTAAAGHLDAESVIYGIRYPSYSRIVGALYSYIHLYRGVQYFMEDSMARQLV